MFLDQVRLIAVDHPADVEVYPERRPEGAAATAFKSSYARRARST